MSVKFFDRVKETATSTGTEDFTLAGAESGGFRSFSSVLSVFDTCYYTIVNSLASEWESGLGIYSASNTLTRTSVLSSSNSNNLVNFSAGTKDVMLVVPAAWMTALNPLASVVDLSGASSDYTLAIGEKAQITFTSQTSVPLHIAVSTDAQYRVEIKETASNTTYTAGSTWLQPNNTTYSNQFRYREVSVEVTPTEDGSVTPSGWQSTVHNAFQISYNQCVRASVDIVTSLYSRSVCARQIRRFASDSMNFTDSMDYWNNTSDSWTSLGTVVFPFTHTGIITIERVF